MSIAAIVVPGLVGIISALLLYIAAMNAKRLTSIALDMKEIHLEITNARIRIMENLPRSDFSAFLEHDFHPLKDSVGKLEVRVSGLGL